MPVRDSKSCVEMQFHSSKNKPFTNCN